jgi:hypothetical protein
MACAGRRRGLAHQAKSKGLDGTHAALLAAADFKAITALGVHPLVPFLARMQIERERK